MFLSPILILALLFSSCDDNSGKAEETKPNIPAEATVTATNIELDLNGATGFTGNGPAAEAENAIVLALPFRDSEPFDIGTFYGKLGTDGKVTFTLPEEGITATEEILEKPWSLSGAWSKTGGMASIKAGTTVSPEYVKETKTLKFSDVSGVQFDSPKEIKVTTAADAKATTSVGDGTYTIKEDRSKIPSINEKGEVGNSIFTYIDIAITVTSGKASATGTLYLAPGKSGTDFAQSEESNNLLFSVDKDDATFYDVYLTGGKYDGTSDSWELTAISITEKPKATIEVQAAGAAATAYGNTSTGDLTIETLPSRAVGSSSKDSFDIGSLFDSIDINLIVGGSEGSYTAGIGGTITLKAGKETSDLNSLKALVFDDVTLGGTEYDNVILVTKDAYSGAGNSKDPFTVTKAIFTPTGTDKVSVSAVGITASVKDGAHGTLNVTGAPSAVFCGGMFDKSLISDSNLTVIVAEGGTASVSGTLTLAEGKTPYDINGLYQIDFTGVKIGGSETTYKLSLEGLGSDYDGFSYEGKAEWAIEKITLKPEAKV